MQRPVSARPKVSVTFNINGRAMSVIERSPLYRDDPGPATDPVHREATEALRYADVGTRGKGKTYEVTCSPVAATVIMDFCLTTGNLLRVSGEQEKKRDGDALLVAADRAYWKLRELQS